ncbi:ClpP/crotonase [Tilletiaria anomala UBC 951]|uniref:ClpP/crotonase n=1 Tax=Tilletiaria anomala (strain ATCC 24038 / CBS 436.72 / UBC 951) TaxID=1037660 RepID=A0A066VPX6_TILAU|nr:ClpP/crotonase [Tilletiaria anomala UBC 951]KDN42308.1 ClpP/crotonase [Tilletiaria anomala UBC 951]
MSSMLSPPSVGEHLLVTVPAPHVLMLTLNRPKQLNSMTKDLELDLGRVLDWFEDEPALWVGIITGRGRAFCAGQDLKSWQDEAAARRRLASSSSEQEQYAQLADGTRVPLQPLSESQISVDRLRKGGFGSISSRRSSKPIIAAIDGICMGGGMEVLLNCDLAVATDRSRFALPEVSRGVIAAQGGIARVAKVSGHHRASELLLTGSAVSAAELYSKYQLLNSVVHLPPSASLEAGQVAVERAAVALAARLCENSPDALLVTKEALNAARDYPGPTGANAVLINGQKRQGNLEDLAVEAYTTTRARALYVGENINEGLTAFREKRAPRWRDPVQFQRQERNAGKL